MYAVSLSGNFLKEDYDCNFDKYDVVWGRNHGSNFGDYKNKNKNLSDGNEKKN